MRWRRRADAASCVDSWNADANFKQQATLARVRAANKLLDGKFRVGTWPEGDQKVIVTEGWGAVKKGQDAVVSKGNCVVVLPDSSIGQMGFVETDGKSGFVQGQKSAEAPLKSAAGAQVAEPDALGKLKLEN